MLINKLYEIINKSKTENILSRKLNSLYDEFRSGRNSNEILELLKSEDDLYVWHGCSICCEIIIKNSYDREILIKELLKILEKSKNSNNRERAFSALYGFYMDVKDIAGFNKICEKYKDDINYEISYFAANFLKDSNFKRS